MHGIIYLKKSGGVVCMKLAIHNKLVRDNIPRIIIESGKNPITSTLSEDEYTSELRKKLQEELDEFLEADNLEELADMVEVIEALAKLKGESLEGLLKIKDKKQRKNGAFDKRIFLESVER